MHHDINKGLISYLWATCVILNVFGVQEFYSVKFGDEVVEIIKDSNPVDKNKLDPAKVKWYVVLGIHCRYWKGVTVQLFF